MYKLTFKKLPEVDLPKLIWALVLCFGAGFLGSLFTAPAIPTWYAELNKPVFTPPNWLFGPVWSFLYGLMAVALYLIWQQGWGVREVRLATYLFGAQLFFNALWSVVFFGAQQPMLAFVVIMVLWSMILFLIFAFFPLNRWAAYLLFPYIVWVGFAAVLNFFIIVLN